jgi:hypothetical protein
MNSTLTDFAGYPCLKLDNGAVSVWLITSAGPRIIGFSLAGYFLDFSRLYVYGVLYAIPYSLRITFKQNNPDLIWISYFAALVAAGIIVLVGVILLMRFLRDYPLPIEEAPIEEKALERNH